MFCEVIFKQSCGISLVDGKARCPIGGDLDQREWPAKLCIVVHGGSCCLQSTSAKNSLSAFSRSRRHQIRILFDYSTTYRTQFQYIFMPPPVKCSFKMSHRIRCYTGAAAVRCWAGVLPISATHQIVLPSGYTHAHPLNSWSCVRIL